MRGERASVLREAVGETERKEEKMYPHEIINFFPRQMLKVKHRGGEQREVTYDRNTNANWRDGKENGFRENGKSVCSRQLVKWQQRWRKG